jgi:hypothetical protein
MQIELPDFLKTPGLHPNVSHEAYHGRYLGVVSKSALDLVNRSPAHYKAWADGDDVEDEDEESDALLFGRAFHCSLLEPERYAKTFAFEPDFGDCRKKDNKAVRDAWRADHASHELIPEGAGRAIERMVASVRAHPLAGKMVREEGESELTLSWKDEETGLLCKSRADYYVRRLRMVLDAKSALNASYKAFRRDIPKYRYHVQDALYRAGFAAIEEPIQHFVFIAVEKTPPFAVALYTLDADAIGKGYSAARRDMEKLAECVASNEFPGYPPGITEIELPEWAA